jgi:hypothetical protein
MVDEIGIEDFGFSMTTEESIKKSEKDNSQAIQDQVTKAQLKLNKIKNKVWPLLMKLKNDPHLDIIKWDGASRLATIDKMMQDITAIIAE